MTKSSRKAPTSETVGLLTFIIFIGEHTSENGYSGFCKPLPLICSLTFSKDAFVTKIHTPQIVWILTSVLHRTLLFHGLFKAEVTIFTCYLPRFSSSSFGSRNSTCSSSILCNFSSNSLKYFRRI